MTSISSLEAIPIAYPEPNDDGRTRHVCLVRATTDDGLVGWGEATTYWPEASRAVRAIIEGLAELVVGANPMETERIWRGLRRQTWWYGNGGVASMAIAGIDIAVWDLKGKMTGMRVLDLLGGAAKDTLPAIASGHASKHDLGALAEEAADWVAGGMHGLKVGFGKKGNARLGYERSRDIDYVRRVREAIGSDKHLIIDLGVAIEWDVAEAVDRVRAFEEFGLYWIEEPLGHWNPSGYATLREKTTTRIAYGEKEFGVEGVQRILETGTCDVLGFDPGRAEGISGFRRAVERVEAAGAQANAHAWSTAILSAASLAVSWATPVCRQFEVKPLPDLVQTELVASPIAPENGFMPEPVGPGLGVEVMEDVVAYLRLDD